MKRDKIDSMRHDATIFYFDYSYIVFDFVKTVLEAYFCRNIAKTLCAVHVNWYRCDTIFLSSRFLILQYSDKYFYLKEEFPKDFYKFPTNFT